MIAYLDNNSTTECASEVIAAMLPFFSGKHGNAASPHALGREAARAVTGSREQIAECVDCEPSEIYFTSCATEANNLAILGLARTRCDRRKIVTSAIEHKSVLGPCEFLADAGYEVVLLPVSRGGIVDLDAARKAIDERTLLVAIQGANNEIGVIQPVREIVRIAHERGAFVHCDAAQLLGKVPVSTTELGADSFAFSAHKAYGPKGVGFLVAINRGAGLRVSPVQFGGGQENGMRPGTLNVPGIVGTGEACRLCRLHVSDDVPRIRDLRAMLEESIRRIAPRCAVLATDSARLPGTSCVVFDGIPAELLIARTPGVCMSMGSACTSGAIAPSHVLLALGLTSQTARCAVRLSLGRYNTAADIQTAMDAIADATEAIPHGRAIA